MIGQTFGHMRNKIFTQLLQNKNIIKSLVVEDKNFLDIDLNDEQQKYIDNPRLLIRNYMYPYKRIFDTTTEKKTIISMQLSDFRKQGKNYRNGLLTFYILTPIELENTIYELILGDCSIEDCIIKEVIPNISVIPSNVNLAAAEIELIGIDKKEFILRNEVDWVKDRYDYIIIDCPPSLSLLTVNAMTTADSVIVPIQCEYYALEGLSQLIHTVNLVKERLNPDLEMEGVVFTMYDSRTNLSAQVVENVKNHLDQKVYDTLIPRNIRLAEAPSYGQPINIYDPKSTGAESYMALAEEVIKSNS